MPQLLVNNDNDVLLQGYRLASTGAPVGDALPSFTVYLADGITPVAGLVNVAMSSVGTNGDYRGLIPGTARLTAGGDYTIVVTFSNYNDRFQNTFTAAVRSGANA